MSNLAERLANLEGALVAPMAVPNKKATISGEEFRRRMAEGKARAKAKRDAEKAGVSGAIGAKIFSICLTLGVPARAAARAAGAGTGGIGGRGE